MRKKSKIFTYIIAIGVVAWMLGTISPAMALDGYEDNDSLENAASVTVGTFSGLDVQDDDDDYYTITVPAGQRITVFLTFSDGMGDIDLELLDSYSSILDESSSLTDQENATYMNAAVSAKVVIIHVFMNDYGSNTYTMEVTFGIPGTISGYDVFILLGSLSIIGMLLVTRCIGKGNIRNK